MIGRWDVVQAREAVTGGLPSGSSRGSRRLTAAAVASLLTCLFAAAAGQAQANIAASRRAPAEIGGPDAIARTPLRVDTERLTFDCYEVGEGVECSFEALYTISNPLETSESAAAAFYGVGVREIRLRVDSRRTPWGGLSAAELERLDVLVAEADVAEAPTLAMAAAVPRSHERWGFVIDVEPRSSAEILVSGVIEAGAFSRPEGYLLQPSKGRHIFFGADPRAQQWDLDYLLSPIRSWASVGDVQVRVSFPRAWTLRGGVVGTSKGEGARQQDWAMTSEGHLNVASMTIDAEVGRRLYLNLERPAETFAHGGPLLAVGGALGAGGGPRFRVGWEVAAPAWVLYELSADLSTGDRLVVTPTMKLASPLVFIIPSLSVGLGLPLKVSPAFDVGARAQLDLQFAVLGFVASFDLFPGMKRDDPDFFEAALMAQVSF